MITAVQLKLAAITWIVIIATYLWLAFAMMVLNSPIIAMIIYHPVFCLGGGLLIRRSTGKTSGFFSEPSLKRPALTTLALGVVLAAAVWSCNLLIEPGLVDPEIVSDGLRILGMHREHFWLAAGLLVIVNPFGEEFLWRGSVLRFLASRMSRSSAVQVSAVFFAGYHPMLVSMVFPKLWLVAVLVICYLGGLILANLYIRTRNLLYPIAVHMAVNIALMFMGYLYAPSSTP